MWCSDFEDEAFNDFGWCGQECDGSVGGCLCGCFVWFKDGDDFANFPE